MKGNDYELFTTRPACVQNTHIHVYMYIHCTHVPNVQVVKYTVGDVHH